MFEGSNVRAVVFDLDGTLVETEHLKAEAYADLIGTLNGKGSSEQDAIDLYRSMVGATDMTICEAMVERFHLEPRLEPEPGETAVTALHRQRMAVYRRSYGTPENLRGMVYSHSVDLARMASSEGLAVGVATMSFAEEARRVLGAIGLSDTVQAVVGVDDVTNPKPAPDAFLLAMKRLRATPNQTLIIEDSPRGAQAADASGARWICVGTEFSTEALRRETGLDQNWIAWQPEQLPDLVARRVSS